MSFTLIKNNKFLSIDPWGTPNVIYAHKEKFQQHQQLAVDQTNMAKTFNPDITETKGF